MKFTFFAVLIIFLAISSSLAFLQPQRLLEDLPYAPETERGKTVQTYCSSTINRDALYDQYGLTGDIPHGNTVAAAFDFDSTLIQLAIKGQWNQFGDKVRASSGNLFAYVGAWVIGLGIALLLWPFLLCCCICPWSCPPCNKKRQNMPYTKCQMIWPAIFTLLFLITVLATSIVGISSRFKAEKHYNQVACATGVILDNFLHGNMSLTTPKTYFKGLRNLDTDLRNVNNKITVLNQEIGKLSSASSGMVDAKTKMSASKTSTSRIPSTSEQSLILTYNTPLQQTPGSTTSAIQSIFPTILGNKNVNQSLVGAAFTSLTTYESVLNQVSSAADQYKANEAQYTDEINKALNQSNRYATDLEEQDSKANDFFIKNGDSFKGATIGEYIFFAVLIGLIAVMIIAVSCTAFCMSNKCRIFMYTICFLLFFFCIAAFTYCIFVSLLNPVLYYSCQYLNENLNSKVKLQKTLIDSFGLTVSVAGNVSQCLAADGQGDLAEKILGQAVFTAITTFNSTYSNLININTSLISYVTLIHNSILSNVTAFQLAEYPDITDQFSLFQLVKLANSSNYDCISSGFTEDSWIPAINQYVTYSPCKFGQGPFSSSLTCNIENSFIERGPGCVGCMDTYDFFKGNSSFTSVNAALTARYPDPSCTVFNTELSNVWENFYKKKRDVIGPVLTRASIAKNNSDAVVQTVNYFTQVKNNIQSNFTSIVDSQFGLLNGLNCDTSSGDIRLLKNVACKGIFVYTYFARVIFGILSFALLFLMCCITCVGHRNVKQLQFNKRPDPYVKQAKSPTLQQENRETQQRFMYGINLNVGPYSNQNYQTQNQNNPYAMPNHYNPPYTVSP